MSIHRSLAAGDKLKRHKNVLTREERIQRLLNEGRWEEGNSIFALPKVGNIKRVSKKKKKAKEEEEEKTEEGEAATADAPKEESAAK